VVHDISEYGKTVIIRDGSELRVLGCGTILTKQAKIEGCLYIPDLWTHLISLGTCHEKDLSTVAEVTGVCALKRGETRVIEGRWINRTYVLSIDVVVPTVANVAATVTDWHRKFALIAPSTIERMRKLGACEGIEVVIKSPPPRCLDCAVGKCTRTSHPPKSTRRARLAGQVLYLDTIVSMRRVSLGGHKYFVLCRDELSTYKLVEFVCLKTEVADHVKLTVNKARLETYNDVLRIHTDNGSEFPNKSLGEFLLQHGIDHTTSATRLPANDLVERQFRGVRDCARTMLIASKLPDSLWAEAVNTSVHVLNRVVGKADPMTSYQLWFGRKPNVADLHRVESAQHCNRRVTAKHHSLH